MSWRAIIGLAALEALTGAQAATGYAFLPTEDAEPSRWIATLERPSIDSVDARQSAPFPSTRLHLTFDELVDRRVLEGIERQRISVAGDILSGARGNAVQLTEALVFELPAEETWSFFAWVRSEDEGPAFTVGEFTGTLQGGGLTVEGASAPLHIPLEPGWNWVGLVRETVLAPSLRVSSAGGAWRSDLTSPDDETAKLRVRLHSGVALDDVRVEHGSLSTLGFGRVAHPPRAIQGGWLALRDSDGIRRDRAWTVESERILAGEALHSGSLDHLSTSPQGLEWTAGQWRQDDTDIGPRPRTTHPTLSLGDGRVLIFGGETRDSHVHPQINDSEVWIYTSHTRSWRLAETNDGPSPRCHLAAAYSPKRGEVFLAGGWCNSDEAPDELYSDAWTFDVAREHWSQLETPTRHGFSDRPLVHVPEIDSCLLFLSYNVARVDLEQRRFTVRPLAQPVDTANQPAERSKGYSESYAYDPVRKRVILFGGQVSREVDPYHSELLAYEWESETLRVLGEGDPAPRVRPGFGYDAKRDRFVLFGGVHGQWSTRFADLWVLDPTTDTWSPRSAAGAPSQRGGFFQMAYDEALDRFFLVAGRQSAEIFLDEVWRLHLDDGAVGRATWAFDAEPSANESVAFVEGSWSPEDDVQITTDWSALGALLVSVSIAADFDPANPERRPEIHRVGIGALATLGDSAAHRVSTEIPTR